MRVYEAKLTYEATLFEVGANSLSTAENVYDYMKDTLEVNPMQEVFHVVLLNQKNKPLGRVAITSGTVSGTLIHPREVFRPAILAGASAIVCTHNHPSGVMPHSVLCRTEQEFGQSLACKMRHKTSLLELL